MENKTKLEVERDQRRQYDGIKHRLRVGLISAGACRFSSLGCSVGWLGRSVGRTGEVDDLHR
jgi:hypothetical protein